MIYRSLVNSSEALSEARFEAIKKEQPLALLKDRDQIDRKEQMHVKRRSKALEVCFQRSVRVDCCNRRTVGALTERQRCTGHKWKLNGPPEEIRVLRKLGVDPFWASWLFSLFSGGLSDQSGRFVVCGGEREGEERGRREEKRKRGVEE